MNIERIKTKVMPAPDDPVITHIQVVSPKEAAESFFGYYWNYDAAAYSVSIFVTCPRSGVGRVLVGRFRKRVGVDLPITGYVTHKESHTFVRDQGWHLGEARFHATELFPEQFTRIPIIQFAQRSGLTIERVLCTYFSHTDSINLQFRGHT